MELRRLASHEVALHRHLRLRALRDAPDSFGESYAAAAERPIAYWEDLTRSVTEPGSNVMILACQGDDTLGSARGNRYVWLGSSSPPASSSRTPGSPAQCSSSKSSSKSSSTGGRLTDPAVAVGNASSA